MTSITRMDFLILDEIDKKEKNTVTQIGKLLGCSQSLVSQRIQKFYDTEIVDYDTTKKNRSMKWYYLTDIGKSFFGILKKFDWGDCDDL